MLTLRHRPRIGTAVFTPEWDDSTVGWLDLGILLHFNCVHRNL